MKFLNSSFITVEFDNIGLNLTLDNCEREIILLGHGERIVIDLRDNKQPSEDLKDALEFFIMDSTDIEKMITYIKHNLSARNLKLLNK